jgi:hypothetical protein
MASSWHSQTIQDIREKEVDRAPDLPAPRGNKELESPDRLELTYRHRNRGAAHAFRPVENLIPRKDGQKQ